MDPRPQDPYYPPMAPQPPYYPAPPTPVYVQVPVQDPNRGLRRAGTVAIWMWIAITMVPLALIALCAVCCMGGWLVPIIDPVKPTPSGPLY